MTARKHLKDRVRARMERTGERYAAAYANLTARDASPRRNGGAAPASAAIGVDAETSGLTRLFAHAGLMTSEALTLVIAGGIGIGVFTFHYRAEGISTFYVAGRHRWDDPDAYIRGACERLGMSLTIAQTTSPAVAARQLQAALERGPVMAWVDSIELGTRALPAEWSGGGYHAVVVLEADPATDLAVIADLSDVPIEVPLSTLAGARARIGRYRHRLASVSSDEAGPRIGIASAVRVGIAATVDAFDHPRSRNFSLGALADWAARLRGRNRSGWATAFGRGEWLFLGLTSIHDYVEHQGGGGLLRPAFATGLREAAPLLDGDERVLEAADRYDALGTAWVELARAALPDAVEPLARSRIIQDELAAAYRAAGSGARDELVAGRTELAAVRAAAAHSFPLTEAETRDLLDDLAARVDAIRVAEAEALEVLRSAVT